MGLERPELSCQHLMVRVARNKHGIVEIAVLGHLVCVEGEPCVYALLDDCCMTVVIDLAQMLVVEYHIVLDKGVLELSFLEEKMLAACVIYPVSSSVIMSFGNGDLILPQTVHLTDVVEDEVEQTFETDALGCHLLEGCIHFGVVSSVDEYSDRSAFCSSHSYMLSTFKSASHRALHHVAHIGAHDSLHHLACALELLEELVYLRK